MQVVFIICCLLAAVSAELLWNRPMDMTSTSILKDLNILMSIIVTSLLSITKDGDCL
ncbi:hypothetical protein CBL_02777 [Carabus blaptoides fortunei]